MKKLKLSTIYWILTALFVAATVAGMVYFFYKGGQVSTLWGVAPCAIALLFSSLAVRAKSERK